MVAKRSEVLAVNVSLKSTLAAIKPVVGGFLGIKVVKVLHSTLKVDFFCFLDCLIFNKAWDTNEDNSFKNIMNLMWNRQLM